MNKFYGVNIYLEYFLLLIVTFPFRFLSWGMSRKYGAFLGSLVRFGLPRRAGLVKDNLRRAFPEKSAEELTQISLAVWKNLGMTLAEFWQIVQRVPRHPERIEQFVSLEGEEYLKQAEKRGRGVIIVTAHLGNWEVAGLTIAQRGFPTAAIAHPLKNPLVDRLLLNFREVTNSRMFPHRGATANALRWLKGNRVLIILIDQNLPQGGTFVDFFGYPAATSPLVSLLAEKTGAQIVPMFSWREQGKIQIRFLPGPTLPISNRREDIRQSTQQLTSLIEGWIRQYPEQWFWVHNRWKRKPDES